MAVFCARRRLLLSIIYSRFRGLRPSFLFLKRDLVGGGRGFPISFVASGQSPPVKLRQLLYWIPIMKCPHKLDGSLRFSFRLSAVWSAQDGVESVESCKPLKLTACLPCADGNPAKIQSCYTKLSLSVQLVVNRQRKRFFSLWSTLFVCYADIDRNRKHVFRYSDKYEYGGITTW